MVVTISAASLFGSIHPTEEQVRQWAIWMPKPTYPISARLRYVTGSGYFGLLVEVKTGLVKLVKTLQTTGDADLDNAAKAALQQWRFKPGVLPSIRKNNPRTKYPHADEYCQMRVPIVFSLKGTFH
jgi:TonB family protein